MRHTLKTIFLILILQIIDFAEIAGQVSFEELKYRPLGPARGGRVTTVAGTIKEPGTFYMGATGGGVWKSEDYGNSWNNVSDGYFETPSIGAISVSQNDPKLIYVGTGSDGLRSNVIAGKGVYKSVNGGASWENIGLKKVGQIGAVEIDPNDDKVVYVAAIGQAFNPNPERGIYKTVNGGKSWELIKFISQQTGFSDIELFRDNSNELLAAAWEVERKPWTIKSGGYEGGIFKSSDGGVTWAKVENGLPKGQVGKIDLAISPSNPRIVYALVEAEEGERGLYRSNNRGENFTLVSKKKELTTRPFYYTNVAVDPQNSDLVYVMATGYFKSTNGGKTWNTLKPPHGDNHDMWINPDQPNLFIQANDGGANVTFNGGKTWSTQFNQPTAELYQVAVDDQYPYWLYAGQQDGYSTISVPSMAPFGNQRPGTGWIVNTGGCETGPAVPKPGNADIVYANCKGRFSVYHKPSGTEKRYDVGAANMYGQNPIDLKFRFQRVSPIHVSPHDPTIIYHTSQYVHKTRDEGKTWEIISPDLTAFEPDKQVISGGPLTRDITGEEFYSTIYAIQESKIVKGVIWVGANDGPVHVTKDGGKNWQNVTPKELMRGGRVDAVEPSVHQASKAYVSILRYQLGDWRPYIYKTENYGEKWELLTDGKNGIPNDYPVRVIREDPSREGLLYAGTEYGMFISFNDGKDWEAFQQNLPLVPITDIKIHRGDLVLSTMGRGFWVLDGISSLAGLELENNQSAQLLPVNEAVRYRYPKVRNLLETYPKYPKPNLTIDYVLKESDASPIQLTIYDDTDKHIITFISKIKNQKNRKKVIADMGLNTTLYFEDLKLTTNKGINRFKWDFRHLGVWEEDSQKRYLNGPLVSPGNYNIVLTVNGESYKQSVSIKVDPRLMESGVSVSDIKKQEEFTLELVNFISKMQQFKYQLTENNKSRKNAKKKREASAVIAQLETKKGTYEEPKLIDQAKYLFYLINGGDQLPGKDAYDRLAELKSEFKMIRSKVPTLQFSD